MTESVQTICPPLPHQEPPRRARTHLEEKLPCLVLQMEMPMCLFGSPRRAACLLQYPVPSQKSSNIAGWVPASAGTTRRDPPNCYSRCSVLIQRTSSILSSFPSFFS